MLPLIGRDLHAGVAELAWVANAYVLTYAVFLASVGGWRFIFWNLAGVAVLAMLAAGAVLVGSRGAPRRLDVPGLALISVSLVALNLGLLEGATWGWLSVATLAVFALAVVTLGSFVVWERACGEPMVRLKTFANPSFLGNTLAGACGWFFALAVVIYTSIYLQSNLGMGLLAAGAVLPAWGAVSAAPGLSVERATRIVGAQALLVASLVAMVLVLAPWAFATSTWPVWLLVVFVGLVGAPFAYVIARSAGRACTGFA